MLNVLDEQILEERTHNTNIRKIGIVDDNPGHIRMLKELLMAGSRFDLRFREFTDPEQALEEICDANGYDLLLIDFHLQSVIDGAEVVIRLREEDPGIHCPCIILSIDEENIKRVRPIKDTLTMVKPDGAKPRDLHNFCKAVDQIIDHHNTNSQFGDLRFTLSKIIKFVNPIPTSIEMLRMDVKDIQENMVTKEDLEDVVQRTANTTSENAAASIPPPAFDQFEDHVQIVEQIKSKNLDRKALVDLGVQLFAGDPLLKWAASLVGWFIKLGVKAVVLIIFLTGLLIVLITQSPNLQKTVESLTKPTKPPASAKP